MTHPIHVIRRIEADAEGIGFQNTYVDRVRVVLEPRVMWVPLDDRPDRWVWVNADGSLIDTCGVKLFERNRLTRLSWWNPWRYMLRRAVARWIERRARAAIITASVL